MRLDQTLILAMLHSGSDMYLVGYRWKAMSPHAAIAARRNIIEAQARYPHLVSTATFAAQDKGSDASVNAHQILSKQRSSLGTVPTVLHATFIEMDDGAELIIFAHHLFYDGTAVWNITQSLFKGDFTPLATQPELRQIDRTQIQRLRKRVTTIAPASHSSEFWDFNTKLTKAMKEACVDAIISLELFDRIVAPHRTCDDPTRSWGSFVEYKEIYGRATDNKHSPFSTTASISFDLFAQGDPTEGLTPLGIYSFAQRTSCDILIEQIGPHLRTTVSTSSENDEQAIKSVLQKAVRRFQ